MKHFFFTLALCFSVHICTIHADDIIVPTDDYPPWKITENGQVTGGIDILIITALLDGLDLTPLYTTGPWKRCLLMMEQSSGDLISGVTLNSLRQKYLTYLRPPYKTNSTKILYVRRGNGTSYQSLSDLEQKCIGILRGGKYFPSFDQNPAIFKTHVDSDLQGLLMLAAGRLDGFLITKENGEYLLQKHPETFESLEKALWSYDKDIEVYFAISKDSILMSRKHELESRLQHLVESGKVDEIIDGFVYN